MPVHGVSRQIIGVLQETYPAGGCTPRRTATPAALHSGPSWGFSWTSSEPLRPFAPAILPNMLCSQRHCRWAVLFWLPYWADCAVFRGGNRCGGRVLVGDAVSLLLGQASLAGGVCSERGELRCSCTVAAKACA
jgi:hypothetical protein